MKVTTTAVKRKDMVTGFADLDRVLRGIVSDDFDKLVPEEIYGQRVFIFNRGLYVDFIKKMSTVMVGY